MSDSLYDLIERKRQFMAEIVAKLNEVANIDRVIEREALRSMRTGEDTCPDFSTFKDETERLLMAFWEAPNKTLSQEDIRQDVILDDDASDGAVRHVINRARKALREANSLYNIMNVRGKGYSLTNREVFQNVIKKRNMRKEQNKKRIKR